MSFLGSQRPGTLRALLGTVGFLVLGALLGCGREPTLLGHWRHASEEGQIDELIFHRDGTVVWRVVDQDSPATHGLRYEVDTTVLPHRLDIGGFQRGPLTGQTLFGIFEFQGRYGFRWEAEAGPAPAEGTAHRPSGFTARAQRFERVR